MQVRLLIAAASLWPATAVPQVRAPAPSALGDLRFVPNRGQFRSRALYVAGGTGYSVHVCRTEVKIVLHGGAGRQAPVEGGALLPPGGGLATGTAGTGPRPPVPPYGPARFERRPPPPPSVLTMRLLGANAKPSCVGLDKLETKVNYFLGNDPARWRSNLPTYGKVKITGVYPGVDVVYYGVRGERREASGKAGSTRHPPLTTHLEYDLIVHPGADPRRIKLAFEGASSLRVAGGDLIAATEAGDVRIRRPLAYQRAGSRLRRIACDWTLTRRSVAVASRAAEEDCRRGAARHTVGFQLARYDATRPLVIDPVLEYGTLFGGSGHDDRVSALMADAAGCAYLAGETKSDDLPTTAGAFAVALCGDRDIFLAKLSASGGDLLFCTYIGGSEQDGCASAALAADGGTVLAGYSYSDDCPTTPGAYQRRRLGSSDAYVAKLDPDGARLQFGTYLGGQADLSWSDCVATCPDTSVAVYGTTRATDFPSTPGAYRVAPIGWDLFVARLSPDGRSLRYSTFLGVDGRAASLAVDGSGRAVVTAHAYVAPTTAGAFQHAPARLNDIYVAMLSSDGGRLEYGTFVGGTGSETPLGLALGATGIAYIVGYTNSPDYPVTPGALKAGLTGYADGVVTALSPDGRSLAFSTYVGGRGLDFASCVAADADGCVVVAGATGSPDFPLTEGSLTVPSERGCTFIMRLDPSGARLLNSLCTSPNRGSLGALAWDPRGAAYFGASVWPDWFTPEDLARSLTPGAFQTAFTGGVDVVCQKVWLLDPTALAVAPVTGAIGQNVMLQATLTSKGKPLAGKSVSFLVEGTEAGAGTTDASGVAQRGYGIPEGLGTGEKTITARFDRDWYHQTSEGTGTLTVTKANTAMDTPDGDAYVGQGILLTALLQRTTDSAWLAGKTVSFTVGGVPAGTDDTNAWGYAQVSYTVPEGVGAKAVEVAFAGDDLHNPSSATGTLTVTKGHTVLTVPNASAKVGETRILQASLKRQGDNVWLPGKSVAFTVDGGAIGSGTTNADGVASVSYAAPEGVGDHAIGASFAGDANYLASSGSGTLSVTKAATSTYATDRTGTITEVVALRAYLKRLTDNAWVVGRAVAFSVEGTGVGSANTNASGRADLNWTITAGPATRTILAGFAGDANYDPSSDDATLTCQSWTTKMATFNRTARITDRAELKCRLLRSDNVPLYNKSVNFYVDGTFIITRPTNVDGYASYPYYTVPDGAGAGVRTILSEWPGNAGYAAVSKTATLTVLKAIPYIWVLPKTIPQGSIANLYAYFRRLYDYQKQTGKTVDFKISGTVVQTVVTDGNGAARYLYHTTEAPGVYTIRCEFYGDAWVDPGYGEGSLTIL